jgi:hypothetical protein
MGHPVDIFVSAPPDSCKWAVCHDILQDAVVMKECGHSFCAVCAEASLEASYNRCPTCRVFVSGLVPNFSMRQTVELMVVRCPGGEDDAFDDGSRQRRRGENGETVTADVRCDWTGQCKDLIKHEDDCGFKIIKCDIEGCDHECRRQDMIQHHSCAGSLRCHLKLMHQTVTSSYKNEMQVMKQDIKTEYEHKIADMKQEFRDQMDYLHYSVTTMYEEKINEREQAITARYEKKMTDMNQAIYANCESKMKDMCQKIKTKCERQIGDVEEEFERQIEDEDCRISGLERQMKSIQKKVSGFVNDEDTDESSNGNSTSEEQTLLANEAIRNAIIAFLREEGCKFTVVCLLTDWLHSNCFFST